MCRQIPAIGVFHCARHCSCSRAVRYANQTPHCATQVTRSAQFPWLDGATTRVPKLFAVKGEEGGTASFPELDTPTPQTWRDEAPRRGADSPDFEGEYTSF